MVKQTKSNLLIQSYIIAGRFTSDSSKLLRDEVLTITCIMRSDDITEVAQSDALIFALGESWLRRNIDNKVKRKYYASQRMRLNAKFLMEIRKLEHQDSKLPDEASKPSKAMWDFLIPSQFDNAVRAAIQVALTYMDDEEDLRAPSNAIKLKYDLIRLVNAKWGLFIKNNGDKDEIRDCESFLQLIKVEWTEGVTKLARTVLVDRQNFKKKNIPSPKDMSMLTEHLKELGSLKLRVVKHR